MGNGMNKIVSGLYVGNYRDAKDTDQLSNNGVTHILSIHDQAKPLLQDKIYLCIVASDNAQQELTQYFSQCNDFIHSARLESGRVLVHCLAGVSRSVTVTAAYLMTVTNMGWRETLNSIRGARSCANPNFGFQKQLQEFQYEGLEKERKRLREKFPAGSFDDTKDCEILLKGFRDFVLNGDSSAKDGLYELPFRAYKSRKAKSDAKLVESDSQETSQNGASSSSSDGAVKKLDGSDDDKKTGPIMTCSAEKDPKPVTSIFDSSGSEANQIQNGEEGNFSVVQVNKPLNGNS